MTDSSRDAVQARCTLATCGTDCCPPRHNVLVCNTVRDSDPNLLRWRILGILCLCLVLVVASVSSLNVAIPSIVRALDASQTEQLWILDSYALVFAGLLLFAGALGDRYGRKSALLAGLAIFGMCAIAASLAGTPSLVIAARGAMGVGAALIMPATLSIITVVFPPEERGKAIAVWAGFAGAGGAIGLLSSGLLLEHFWWGSVFFVNVPIVLLTFVPIARFVPNSRDEEQRPLDPLGALLSIGGLGSLLFGIINGPEHGWTHPATLAAFVAAGALLAGFVRYEAGASHPMLDPRLFRIRRLAVGSLTVGVAFFAMFGMFFLITLYLQFVQGYSALGAALRMLPVAVTLILVSPQGPRAVARLGARAVIRAGLLIQAAGFALMSTLEPGTSDFTLVVAFVLMATGMALLMPPSTEAIVSSLPANKAGVGSAINVTTREVGGAIGIALLGSLLSQGYRSGVSPVLAGLHVPTPAADAVRNSIAGASALGPQVMQAASGAFADGLSLAFTVAAVLCVLTAVVVSRAYPQHVTTENADLAASERTGQ